MENNEIKEVKKKKKSKKWLFMLVFLAVAGYVVWYSMSPESPQNKPTEETIRVEAHLKEELGPQIRTMITNKYREMHKGYPEAEKLAQERANEELNYSDEDYVMINGVAEYRNTEYSEFKKYSIPGLYDYGSIDVFIHNSKIAVKGTISAFENALVIDYHKVKISDDVEYQYLNGELLLTMGTTLYLWTSNGEEETAQEAYNQYIQAEKFMGWPDCKEFKEDLLKLDYKELYGK